DGNLGLAFRNDLAVEINEKGGTSHDGGNRSMPAAGRFASVGMASGEKPARASPVLDPLLRSLLQGTAGVRLQGGRHGVFLILGVGPQVVVVIDRSRRGIPRAGEVLRCSADVLKRVAETVDHEVAAIL